MAQPLTKIFIIYFAINIVLFMGGVRVIGGDTDDVIGNFVDIDGDTVTVKEEFKQGLPTNLESGFFAGVQQFIDSIGAVKRFIFFMVNIVFTPLGVFMAAGMPVALTLMVGMPLMVVLFFGVAYFIRSGG